MSMFVEELNSRARQRIKVASSKWTYHAVNILGGMVRRLSRKQTRRFAFLLGDFARKVVGIRRELVYRNLSMTFPDQDPAEIDRIATKVYRNVAATLLEVLRLPLVRTREDAATLVDIDCSEFINRTRDGKTGAVLVSAHFGNWELMAMAFGLMVQPVNIIVKRLHNASLDRKMNEYRTMGGNKIIYHSQALREGLKLLADGGLLAILGDQSDANANNFGEFLGRRATMFHGAAFFALKAGVPLFMGLCRSNGDGRYTLYVHEIDTSDLTFNKEDIAILASRYTRVLEEYILKQPEDWFWMHDRWKRQ